MKTNKTTITENNLVSQFFAGNELKELNKAVRAAEKGRHSISSVVKYIARDAEQENLRKSICDILNIDSINNKELVKLVIDKMKNNFAYIDSENNFYQLRKKYLSVLQPDGRVKTDRNTVLYLYLRKISRFNVRIILEGLNNKFEQTILNDEQVKAVFNPDSREMICTLEQLENKTYIINKDNEIVLNESVEQREQREQRAEQREQRAEKERAEQNKDISDVKQSIAKNRVLSEIKKKEGVLKRAKKQETIERLTNEIAALKTAV